MNQTTLDPPTALRVERTGRRKPLLVAFAALVVGISFSVASCSSTLPNRDPLGESFPVVQGKSLEGEEVVLPLVEPTVLLLGYVQNAQFDADRWLVGLLQVNPPVRILEVPTIDGLFPTMLSGTIDSGMRSGIPHEDWSSVVTVYGAGAGRVIEFTGNETPRNIRVLLLDAEGRVVWFHDRGFSAAKLLELERAIMESTKVNLG